MAPDSPAPPAPLPLSLEAYRLLFEANPHAMLLFEVGSWRILASNDAAARLYGWSTTELQSKTLLDIRPPEDAERFVQTASAVGTSVTHVGTVRHRARDGREIIVDITTAGVELDDGRQARLSVITDVTGEHQLQETRDLLASVVAGSHDAIIVTDLRGRVRSWNPGAERMFGYREDEMQGRSIGTVHPPAETGPTFRDMLGDVIAGRAVRMFDAVGRHKDGHNITISMTLSPICAPSGEVVGVSGIERDVTERRAAEQTLRESQARFARIFHSGLILAAVLDLERQTFRDVNDSWLRFFGMKRQELVGASVHGFQDMWLDLDARAKLIASWEAREPIQAVETGFRTRSGPKYALLSVLPGDSAGEDIVMMVDVTEQRRLEIELSEARRLEALGRLAGGVAHDFNNMLSVVGGYADLLEEQMPADSQWRADLGEIRRAAERAAHLTRQLLAFGRRQVLQPKTIDLNEVVRENETFLTRLLGEPMTLQLSLSPEPLWVEADTAQMEQVLLNLATNARDAVQDSGVLQVVTKTRMLARGWAQERGLPPGRVAELAVRDTGRGMNPETLQRIFEPFFTTKDVGEGTGLGLATVYGIVKQSGGHIDAASTPGQGTLFRILLPLVAAPGAAAAPAPETRAEGGTETILLVEDERAVARLAESLLKRLGYRVLAAESASDAMEAALAFDGPIDLVLTDVVMPGASGRVLIEELRMMRPGIRTLYMSGYPADSIVRYGVEEGEVHFLQKPFTLSTLAGKVREALG